MISQWVSEGILIAALPAISYLLIFSFECGYVYYWKIPTELIRINISVLFLGFLGFVFYCLLHFSLFALLSCFFLSYGNLFIFLIPIFVSVIAIFIFSVQFREWLWFILFFVLLLLLGVIVYLFKMNIGGLFLKSFEGIIKSMPLSLFYLFLTILCVVSIFVCFSIGYRRAQKRTEYLVYEDKLNEVVLRQYDNQLICSEIDRKTRVLKGNFIIYQLQSKDGIKFS